MEVKLEQYIIALLVISFVFFILVASWLKTDEAYRDLLFTIAMVHFVMSKLITIKKEIEIEKEVE
ncbi:hypothetical protein MHZ92_15235 [Sporosarcina sp. ACRSL]|uniref:hypothetical protein n=1 Tax=Sporosarcina sp. ACRSL TaxID=2918215 RepID=UPI001EF63065|nr:hypothetical protein [Sporosarcina sp. ACRSL]MCG7345490.1 hypothetical protein [Sporosarcina sp. ACRSL]